MYYAHAEKVKSVYPSPAESFNSVELSRPRKPPSGSAENEGVPDPRDGMALAYGCEEAAEGTPNDGV